MPSSTRSGPTSGANVDQPDQADDTSTDTPSTDVTVTDTAAAAGTDAPTKATGSPYDLVRVKSLTSGNEHTVTRVMAEQSKDLQILNGKPATNSFGKPLPARAKSTNRTDLAGNPATQEA